MLRSINESFFWFILSRSRRVVTAVPLRKAGDSSTTNRFLGFMGGLERWWWWFLKLPQIFLSTWTIYLDIFGLNHTKPKKGCLKLFQNGNLNDVAWLWLMAVDGEFGDHQQHLSMRGCFACFFLNLQVIAHSAVLC